MQGDKWRREIRSGSDFGNQHAGRQMKGDKWRRETRSGSDFGNQQPNLWEVRTPIASSYLGKKGRTSLSLLFPLPWESRSVPGAFKTLMSWADEYRTMQVRANAETKADAIVAKDFGAEGIGLVRTEHMLLGTKTFTLWFAIAIGKIKRKGREVFWKMTFEGNCTKKQAEVLCRNAHHCNETNDSCFRSKGS